MGVEKLTTHQAFKPGSQVWIVPEKTVSGWTRFLDWHLHFLISKLEHKQQKKLDEQVEQTLSEEEINLDLQLQNKYDTVLIYTQEYFPNKSTVMIKNYKTIEQWYEKILQVQKSLQTQSMRIFLPTGCDAQSFLKIAKKDFEDLDVTVLEDAKATP